MTFSADGRVTRPMADTTQFSVENGVLKEKAESAGGGLPDSITLVDDSIQFSVAGTMQSITRISDRGFSGVWQKTIGSQTITITLSENAYKTRIVDASFANQPSLTTMITIREGSLDKASGSGNTRNFTVNKLLTYWESFYTVKENKLTITNSGGSLSYTK